MVYFSAAVIACVLVFVILFVCHYFSIEEESSKEFCGTEELKKTFEG
jgi:hypothetical protein